MTDRESDILKEIRKLGYKHGSAEVFFDVVNMIPHFLFSSGRRSFNLVELAKYEEWYQRTASKYDEDEIKQLEVIYQKIVSLMDENPYDVLGPLYMAIIH